jgi:hypothetical protein
MYQISLSRLESRRVEILVETSRFYEQPSFYERILNEHLLSHENKKTIKHRFSFADERVNRTSNQKLKHFLQVFCFEKQTK